MNALDELRDLIEEHWPHSNPQWRENGVGFALEIDAIADHIEEEYIELPKDMDGEVIHIGDTVYCESEKDGFHVSEIRFSDTEDTALFDDDKQGWLRAKSSTHKRIDTWESLAGEADKCDKLVSNGVLMPGEYASFVRRCKKLAGVD